MVSSLGTRASRRSKREAVRAALRLQDHEIDRVLQRAEVRETGPNEVVVAEGDVADHLFVIVRGKFIVSVTDATARRLPVRMLGTGQCFGEMGLLDGGRRRATVTCGTDDGELLVLTATDLRYLLDGASDARRGLADEAAERADQLSRIAV